MQKKINLSQYTVQVISDDNGESSLLKALDDADELLDDCPLCQILKEGLAKKS